MAILKFQPKNRPAQLRCTGCSTTIDAPCDCGKPFAYIPASEAAAIAIAAHPTKSSRALEADTGIGRRTIDRARSSGGPNGPPAAVTGRDGKTYAATRKPKRKPVKEEEMPTEEEAEASYQATCYDQACRILEEMSDRTRQKFFTHIKRTYEHG